MLGRLRFDKLVIVPLIMDFERKDLESRATYYDRPPAKPLSAQVRDVLIGIRDYRRERPNGFLEIRPFLGINTANYSLESLSKLLETAFDGYERGARGLRPRPSTAMKDFEFRGQSPACHCASPASRSIRPLGFDPWPDEGPERDKVNFLYSFCEKRGHTHHLPLRRPGLQGL